MSIHAKYDVSFSYFSKVMAKVKVWGGGGGCHEVTVTDRPSQGQTNRRKTRCPEFNSGGIKSDTILELRYHP